jgi:hypothetical protein
MRIPSQCPSLPFAIAVASLACVTVGAQGPDAVEAAKARVAVLARGQLWSPTTIRSADLKNGPVAADAFPFRSTVSCTYVDKQLGGNSPKFLCRIGEHDTVKVKFGADNGEVYGEVLATRLLWALGFGADRMYPVVVLCRDCPATLGGVGAPDHVRRFEPAVIERRMAGREWPPTGAAGWAWNELNVVNPRAGGATLAQRDALKLLAVLIQHTDSKPEQQNILCLGESDASPANGCRRPFLMISDLGRTFGRANRTNADIPSSVNLALWAATHVWKHETGCVGNLPKSLTGSLDDPVISEEGRRFLSDRLAQLSDRQLRDLFEVARVELRPRSPGDPSSGHPTVAEWVDAFKAKRAEIAARRCDDAVPPSATTARTSH